ncbi:hypothetical protein M6D93_04110 [Jatrophihabitans telluris]|uniref:Uncharacterized protein n=1 Tax=Jatrophihabitans telluris TaxID=2038343 RepID=A0ABY4QZZ0_9ACTN|nr:hypothetical protein [Jatrophihabitans telluris]UQX89193.1 hypothetical protein M6D93_04110 [Jatrophihabitans telluris]
MAGGLLLIGLGIVVGAGGLTMLLRPEGRMARANSKTGSDPRILRFFMAVIGPIMIVTGVVSVVTS